MMQLKNVCAPELRYVLALTAGVADLQQCFQKTPELVHAQSAELLGVQPTGGTTVGQPRERLTGQSDTSLSRYTTACCCGYAV